MPETLQPPPPPLRDSLARCVYCCKGWVSPSQQYTQLETDTDEDVEQRSGPSPSRPAATPRDGGNSCLTKLGCNLLAQRKVFLVIISSTLIVTVSMGSQEVFALWVLVEPQKGTTSTLRID